MKPTYPGPVQPPRLPRRLPARVPSRLEDGLELSGFSATACDWSGLRAAGVTLEQAWMRRATLAGAHLARPRMTDLRWEALDGVAGEWAGARLRRCEFLGCRMLAMQWLEADLEDVRFQDCVLEGALFLNSSLRQVRFENCNLRGVSLENCRLAGVDLRGCDLRHAILRDTSLAWVDLRGAQLDGLQVPAEALRGAVITPAQAVQAAALLGVRLLDEHADLVEDGEDADEHGSTRM